MIFIPFSFTYLIIENNFQGQRLYNINQEQGERVGRIMIAYADDLKEVSSVQAGNIVVVTGLKVMIKEGDIDDEYMECVIYHFSQCMGV